MAKKLVKVRPLLKPKAQMPWKPAADVTRISFSKDSAGKLIKLGEGLWGAGYIGRIHFRDGSVQRVAIKKFKASRPAPPGWFSDERAEEYRQCIKDLKNAGVRIPKMDLIKLPSGEWVQVSQLFGSTVKGTKIESELGRFKPTEAREAIQEFTKVANAGYIPSKDLMGSFSPGKIIPFDLDLLVSSGKRPAYTRALELASLIREWATDKKEYRLLANIALNAASPELKDALKIAIEQLKKVRRIT